MSVNSTEAQELEQQVQKHLARFVVAERNSRSAVEEVQRVVSENDKLKERVARLEKQLIATNESINALRAATLSKVYSGSTS